VCCREIVSIVDPDTNDNCFWGVLCCSPGEKFVNVAKLGARKGMDLDVFISVGGFCDPIKVAVSY